MPRLSIIQSVYKRNPFILESARLNLLALDQSGVDYELVIFNDHGDIEIMDDLEEIVNRPRVVYVYSSVNYGKGVCAGGWIGGLPCMRGDLIHFANQDDIYTPLFYKWSVQAHEDPTLMMTHTNAIMVDENLMGDCIMIRLKYNPDYYNDPFGCFKLWFGIGEEGQDCVTKANNNVLAPSVIYKKALHDLIGLPDLDTFGGAGDFEYWSRILFNGYRCKFFNFPLWLYRNTQHSTSSNVAETNTQIWLDKIKEKYYNLYEQRKNK